MAPELNRYPDGGAFRLRSALAERFDVPFENVALGAGADGVIDSLTQATLEPGDEIVCGWPSFPSYVIDARKLGAEARLVPMPDGAYDVDALLEAITPRTKLLALCDPNNPTGRMTPRAELVRLLDRVPDHVLTVLDQAYWEYVDEPDYADGIAEFARAGRRVLVLRTFSKIFGLAGLRIGYGVGPADVVAAIDKVRRAFDLTSAGQEMAIVSLGDELEIARRRASAAAGRAIVADALERRRLRRRRPCGRELRLRGRGRGRRRRLRGAAAGGRHRAPAPRVRRSHGHPGHGRHCGRQRGSGVGAVPPLARGTGTVIRGLGRPADVLRARRPSGCSCWRPQGRASARCWPPSPWPWT